MTSHINKPYKKQNAIKQRFLSTVFEKHEVKRGYG